jgi:hypothetical protein
MAWQGDGGNCERVFGEDPVWNQPHSRELGKLAMKKTSTPARGMSNAVNHIQKYGQNPVLRRHWNQ